MSSPDTLFQIDSLKYDAGSLPTFNRVGTQVFATNGAPIPYGPGEFSVTVHNIPYDNSLGDTGDTWVDLLSLWKSKWTSNGFVSVTVYSPEADAYVTVNARLKFPQLLGVVRANVVPEATLYFSGAFLSDAQTTGWFGGWLSTVGTDLIAPPVVPEDGPPDPTPGVNYYYGTGHFGAGYFGRGEGV